MTTKAGVPADDARVAPASARWALGMCVVVCWFFVACAGYATGPLQALPWIFVQRIPNAPLIAVLGLLSLLGFAAPLLPLGTRWSREPVAVISGIATIVAGLAVQAARAAPLDWQMRSSGLVLAITAAVIGSASGAIFLNAVIGLVNRRAVAGGFVGALLLRQIYLASFAEPSIERERFFLGAALGLAAAGVVFLLGWRRAPGEDRADSFERRAGGLRFRGAIALGVLLFFELSHGLPGLASVAWPARSESGAALFSVLALVPPALAWLFVVRGFPVPRHRALAVTFALVLTIGALLPALTRATIAPVAIGALIAQCAALMLFGRALAPASGRRSGRKLATGLAVFVVLTILYALTYLGGSGPGQPAPGRLGSTIVTLVAGAVLAVAMYLTPRPVPSQPPLRDGWLYLIAAAVPLLGLLLVLA